MHYKASGYAERVMNGALSLDEVPEQIRASVLHLLELPVYKLAMNVLQGRDKDTRNSNLNRIPATIRDLVKAEAVRRFNGQATE